MFLKMYIFRQWQLYRLRHTFFSNNISRTETGGLKMGYSVYFIVNCIFIIQILEKQVCE